MAELIAEVTPQGILEYEGDQSQDEIEGSKDCGAQLIKPSQQIDWVRLRFWRHEVLEDDFPHFQASDCDEDQIDAADDPPMIWHEQWKRQVFGKVESELDAAAVIASGSK